MTTFDSWASYFYPETYDPGLKYGTMRNLYGERDPQVLNDREYSDTAMRSMELKSGAVDIPRTYDAQHVMAIHGHVFQDVYEWAGQFRTIDMTKQWPPEIGRGFTEFLDRRDVGRYLDDVQQRIAREPWANMDRDQFAHAAADIFSRVNFAHPAREGNGRTAKLFMQHVAELSKFELNYSPQLTGITPEVWNRMSTLTSPDPHSTDPVPDSMVPVFQRLAQPRQTPIRQLDIAGERARANPRPTLSERIAKGVSELRAQKPDDGGMPGRGRPGIGGR